MVFFSTSPKKISIIWGGSPRSEDGHLKKIIGAVGDFSGWIYIYIIYVFFFEIKVMVVSQEVVVRDSNSSYAFLVHPGKLKWNPNMELWKMIFLFNWVIFRFHANFRGVYQFVSRQSFSFKGNM